MNFSTKCGDDPFACKGKIKRILVQQAQKANRFVGKKCRKRNPPTKNPDYAYDWKTILYRYCNSVIETAVEYAIAIIKYQSVQKN